MNKYFILMDKNKKYLKLNGSVTLKKEEAATYYYNNTDNSVSYENTNNDSSSSYYREQVCIGDCGLNGYCYQGKCKCINDYKGDKCEKSPDTQSGMSGMSGMSGITIFIIVIVIIGVITIGLFILYKSKFSKNENKSKKVLRRPTELNNLKSENKVNFWSDQYEQDNPIKRIQCIENEASKITKQNNANALALKAKNLKATPLYDIF
jgi:hypothetical protein